MFDHLCRFKRRKIFFLFSGRFFALVRVRMDLFHFRFRCIRIRFLLGLIEQVHLRISVRIFFTGSTKPFPPGKRQPVRKQRIHELQLLHFFRQELDLGFLLLPMCLHGCKQCDHIFFGHFL